MTSPTEPATGMWQVGMRYYTMDLNDSGVLGGKMDTVTAGVNWYWRSNFKIALNYVDVNSSKFSTVLHRNVDDNPNIVEARFQVYW